ncbi:Na+/H+ antiporter NhaC family protein [Clostridium algidicarnis]|uniref:Na+/H+ antiporter NhaC family protein n=1 Tax=Clostridium algidicarnis TaxID=37659 RepID=A0ABS6C0P8_9CLOT|nr:Na+/H+ antiporter NhaC family protein [Clostridium algidicarnis]MBB6696957.1 Na+/H+ antiporter NhaC family protein [Clostridium algidicarnis]MBU3193306.1 Na+/H+ antiporter NhaC family protein [Clostridium algidicarnis]MBU3206616.1 Na+/H+ antiporter NhaC family protein [Clostridium algidicarnis]MBU3219049.1 Na+/H+ antiporter NhaC family protein [Clostridium algidicarnis]MCB2286264.1 Na+/H+ antiporter NhaC family protein [Clostridium algidicarnis]
MKIKNRKILLMTGMFICLLSTVVLAADVSETADLNSIKLGVFTLLPPVVAIVLAFITKNVVISLFLGVLVGCFLLNLNGLNIFMALFYSFLDLVKYVLNSLADPWNAGIILQCLTIGGLIALITKMGGTKAVAKALAKKAKGPISAQVITWFLGLLVFFDDYANSLIVGPIMKPVTDSMKVSREKLAFIIDSTAAPIAGLALISTWIGYELSLIKDGYLAIGQEVDAFGMFISTIPYRFYNIFILLFTLFTAIFLREFGPMLKAERRARTTGKVMSDTANPMLVENADEMEPKEGIKLSIWNAIIPIGTLIIGAFAGFYYNGYVTIMAGEDAVAQSIITSSPFSIRAIQSAFGNADASIVIFQAALLASIVAIIMGISKKIFKIGEAIDIWVGGMKSLIITGVILLLAWSLSSVIKELGTAKYLVSLLSDTIPQFLLPALIFLLGSIISFATGTAYGTMGILMPLTIPLASSMSSDPKFVIMSIGAVLTGAIFGDHCSPISDTTILSSMGAGCDHLDHTKTQIWYAIFVAMFAVIFGYIPVGLNVPVYIVLPVDVIILGALVYLIGKPVEVKESK